MILNSPPTSHPFTPVKVVLLSGASDTRTCGLSATQTRFMDSVALPSSCKIYMNFPYLSEYRHAVGVPPLWLASWRNLNQFLGASRDDFRVPAARHLQSLIRSCDQIVIVTLSCGLEILNACLPALQPVTSLHVLALGPVAWQRPPVPHMLVQGTSDCISRLFFRRVETRLRHVGHLNYLEKTAVVDLVNAYVSQHLCGNTSESWEQACTCPPSH